MFVRTVLNTLSLKTKIVNTVTDKYRCLNRNFFGMKVVLQTLSQKV